LRHDANQGVLRFRNMAEGYATALLDDGGGAFDLLGVSNGTGLALEIAGALVRYGRASPRLLLVDPDPPQAFTALSLQAAASNVLILHVSPTPVDAHIVRQLLSTPDADVFAFVNGELRRALGAAAPSMATVTRRVRSFQLLCEAESAYYFHEGERAGAGCGARCGLVLSTGAAQSSKEADVDARAQRAIFGPIDLEVTIEGSHLDAMLSCAQGNVAVFNSSIALLLGLDSGP
jgi:thioesterase domain-containing protein